VNGNVVKTGTDLVNPIATAAIGSKVKIAYVRDGGEKEIWVSVEDRTKIFPGRAGNAGEHPGESTPAEFGLRLQELTPEMAHRVGLEGQKGVLVTEVEPASFGEDVGFDHGDVITAVNHDAVATLADYRRALAKLKPGDDVVFKVHRQDADRALTVFLAGVVPADSKK
jgi:serine protease Do